jgi:hypothetical protein
MAPSKLPYIEGVYIISNPTFEESRYHKSVKWARSEFPSDYFHFHCQCYKHTIDERDIFKYGIAKDKLRVAEVSLIINYMSLFEMLLNKYRNRDESTSFLILESDFIPKPGWRSTLQKQMQCLRDRPFYFLHLGDGGNPSFIPSLFGHKLSDEPDVYPCPSARCAEAIVWSLAGMSEYLASPCKPVLFPLDFYINKICAYPLNEVQDIKTFWAYPAIFSQGSLTGKCPSTLAECEMDTSKQRLVNIPKCNVHFSGATLEYKWFVQRLLQLAWNGVEVFSHPKKQPKLVVSSDNADIVLCDKDGTPFLRFSQDIQTIARNGNARAFFLPRLCLQGPVSLESATAVSFANKTIDITWRQSDDLKNEWGLKSTPDAIDEAKFCLVKHVDARVWDLIERNCVPVFVDPEPYVAALFPGYLHVHSQDISTGLEKIHRACENGEMTFCVHPYFRWNQTAPQEWMKGVIQIIKEHVHP